MNGAAGEDASGAEQTAVRNPLWSRRGTVLALALLSLFLVLVPLTLSKPGLPTGLKADESAYYLMALSLARDFDLRFEEQDQRRLFAEFPYRPTRNLILMTDDGWDTTYFGKPYLYSLAAAPAAGLFRANGLVSFNAALLVAMIWMGTLFLSRRMAPTLAALFSVGFYLLSAISSYVVWIQPEIFNAFCVAAAVFLVFERSFSSPRRELQAWLLSGGFLALAAYGKPMYAALALGLVGPALLQRHWRRAGSWIAGFVALGLLACGFSWLLTGYPSSYLGVERAGVTICSPEAEPPELELRRQAAEQASLAPGRETGPAGSWGWLLRIPPLTFGSVVENVGYFLVGRHTGFLVYFPFAALAVAMLLWRRPRRADPWLLLASLVIIAFFFLLLIAWNWQGGGGFVGNRYYVGVVPAFLYLLPGLSTVPLVVTYTVASLFLGGLVLNPFPVIVPEPTLQAHTRNWPLRRLPLELSLRNVPGYTAVRSGELRIVGRDDRVLEGDGGVWIQGNARVELYLLSARPLERAGFLVRSPAGENRISLHFGGERDRLRFENAGQTARLEYAPKPARRRIQEGAEQWVYRMTVESTAGALYHWVRRYPEPLCASYASDESTNETFWLGAQLVYLGDPALLERDVFAARWSEIEIPEPLRAGQEIVIRGRLRNASSAAWSSRSAARVKASYHWIEGPEDGTVWDGLRTDLPPLEPGEEGSVEMTVRAPEQAGRWTLVLDPVFEHVGWFSERDPASTFRLPVEVLPSPDGRGSELDEEVGVP